METPIAEFQMTGDFHRIISQVAGFPVDTNGIHLVKCLFRERGAADWIEVASYPINLKWVTGNPVVH